MNYKTTNRLLKKGNRRAMFYQVLCAAVFLAVITPASYLYGVMTAGESVNFSLYERVFSESVRPEGAGTIPQGELADALLAFGPAPIERTTYNGLAIWTTSIGKPHVQWESDVSRQWARQGIAVQTTPGQVHGVIRKRHDQVVLLARESQRPGEIEIFAYETGHESGSDSFAAAGLPAPPQYAEIFDYSGSGDSGVALAFRADAGGDVVGAYAHLMEEAGWSALPVPPDRHGARIYEMDGKRVTLRGLDSGTYTYVTLVVF